MFFFFMFPNSGAGEGNQVTSSSQTSSPYEEIKKFDELGNEYWSARDLMGILEYSKWDNFKNVIEKAIEACDNSNINVSDHFPEVGNMINIGEGGTRAVTDYNSFSLTAVA